MKTSISTSPETRFDIHVDYSHETRGYGHYNILAHVQLAVLGHTHTFKYLTTDSEFIDRINEQKSDDNLDVAQEMYHDKTFHHIQDQIINWIESIENDEEE